MQFIRSTELKPGLRIAKPIYNKDGILLYERNSRLTIPAINSILNFDLYGIYILEPAESVPPFTKEDLEFEQLQTIYLFKLKDLFEKVYKRQPLDKLDTLVDDIIKHYGKQSSRVNFNQNIRSTYDFIYKHATSVAILSALIGQHINLSENDFKALITAALLYGFGYRFISQDDTNANTISSQTALEKGTSYLNISTAPIRYLPKALCIAEYYILSNNPKRKIEHPAEDILLLAEILKVAVEFDKLTSINIDDKPKSEIAALNSLRERKGQFNETIVAILSQCVHVLPAGAKVELSNQEKAIVLTENEKNYMHPVLLRLRDNSVCDLSDPSIHQRFQIVNVIKTIDNRIDIDEDTLKQFRKE